MQSAMRFSSCGEPGASTTTSCAASFATWISRKRGWMLDGLLLDWFREHGRNLPWRRTRDPYAVLVSEVMLQQTQVERVVPRYVAWLERWPRDLTELPGVGRYTADAVARFAFDSAVLPVDTNVRRVQERTGASFSAASAHALMDLGATVCLARVPRCGICPLAARCPSRGRRYEPLRRQSPFEGSFRQRRAHALRLVTVKPQA